MVMAATVFSEPAACARTAYDVASSFSSKWQSSLVRKKNPRTGLLLCSSRIRACHSMANNKDIYKQVGLFQNAVFFCVRASKVLVLLNNVSVCLCLDSLK